MKALVKAEAEPGLRLEDVPVPGLGRDDVLIRVLRTGVCGTDLHIYDWDSWAQANVPVPLVIGHEFVGEVVATGSDVQELREGQLVSGEGPHRRATAYMIPATTASTAIRMST